MPDGDPINFEQSCGGQIDSFSMKVTGYYNIQGEMTLAPKGFICPLGQICREQVSNPHKNIQSFENIVFGALQVLVIAGANQWSSVMYQMMDSDFDAASIFFILCIIILNFWLINLFVAVILNTFSYVRVQTRKSSSGPVIDETAEEWMAMGRQRTGSNSSIQKWYLRTRSGWIALAFADIVAQDRFELVITIAFDMEIIWRITGYLPNWREFNERGVNWFDLFLALTTSIIQIPPIHDWQYYPWLTALQLVRFYRVILAVPRMRPFVLRVFGNIKGLWNIILFMTILNFLGALIAVQLFRVDVKANNHVNFRETYSAFLAMYQVFTSENWTDILYLTADASAPFKQGLIAVLFYVGWFFVANFILLQIFVVIFHESFELSEEQKRCRQFDAYLRKGEPDFLFATVDESNEPVLESKALKAAHIRGHPTYDKSFWVLPNRSPLRRLCQKLVTPASDGERIFGVPPSPIAQSCFQLIVVLAVIGGIIVAAIATPAYRRQYYIAHGPQRNTWFNSADIAFASVLILEFLVKIVADGFIFTPNAYLLSACNVVDFIILVASLVNVITAIVRVEGVSHATRSLKAFRALRLITSSGLMRDTFHSVVVIGAKGLIDAALLTLLYMIPYAIWGLNIFSGLMFVCNDDEAAGKSDCTGEYFSQPVEGVNFRFLAPRSWDQPSPSTTFSFDSFGSSLLVLFEIVSSKGWTDVMGVATDLVGRDLQPRLNNSRRNSLYFLIYHLLGAVIIFTLFVSIIIGNFTSRSGTALLTEDQRRWLNLQKYIKRQRPSKRPRRPPTSPWRFWCFNKAVKKNGWWSRGLTGLYTIHIVALAAQTFTISSTANRTLDSLFLVLVTIYVVDIVVRISGLGLRSFRANRWNLVDAFVLAGSFATTLPILHGSKEFSVKQLQKLFLVCIAFKLVQRNSGLDRLLKTSLWSLSAILKLLLLWTVLFLFFSIIFVEVFGLTRWGGSETHTQNYRDFFNAIIMLAFMSTGEKWNQHMHDLHVNLTISYPACTSYGQDNLDSDCGSIGWAYFLFITWNLLSMYIFVNMFTGLVVEDFSWIFQLSNSGGPIDRHDMRNFKKAWAQFDVDGTGFLTRARLVPFLSILSGGFEARIHPIESSIARIMEQSRADPNDPGAQVVYSYAGGHEIDIRKLVHNISRIDQWEISRRRATFVRLYYEAMLMAEPGKGISFTNMLLLLTRYKMINENSALGLAADERTVELTDDLLALHWIQVRRDASTPSHKQ
ncbi:calcium channel protein, partial [Tulasnella sp. UAMH 9824]